LIDPARQLALREAIEDLYFGYRAFTELPDAILGDRGLGRTHHRILYFVCREPGVCVGDLLGVLRISKQAAHRPLRELERQSLIVSAVDPADRRVRRLSPTPSGSELEAQLSTTQMQLLEETFRRAGPAAEQQWRLVMGQLRRSESA
jgi:DNA-binding MarR family transcriptional regulator